jgi:polysaccharide export outer membrane protein
MGWLNRRFLGLALVLITGLGSAARFAAAQDAPAASPPGSAQPAQATPAVPAPDGAPEAQAKTPLLQLGPGDSVSIQVYGQPDMSATVYVSDDGTIPVPLVGMVQVGGLSPSQASNRIEAALRNGNFLVDPHVTLTVVQSRSQRVSVLGSVGTPGRYPIESNTSIFDLLAQAGGVTEAGSDVVYLIRQDKDGKEVRYPIDLKGLADSHRAISTQTLKGGDTVFVPKAQQFSIYGEVATPGRYRVEPGMTVIEAIARAGGITQRGSQRRVEIKRKLPDGNYGNVKAKFGDTVQPDDVIHVKESIF